jgi:hypothetical protein
MSIYCKFKPTIVTKIFTLDVINEQVTLRQRKTEGRDPHVIPEAAPCKDPEPSAVSEGTVSVL